ncbi:hypothetical protein KO317_02510 [Candidatus Micrarchaeota archaeon]|nr:hypothetical protein [Candidatus Micrarchaeota archaeon]
MKKSYLIGVFIFLFILGCVDRTDILYNTTGVDRNLLYTTEGLAIGEGPEQTNLSNFIKDFCDESGVCIAFVCKNQSRDWLIDLLPWTKNTLKGGQCWVIKGNSSNHFTDIDSTLLSEKLNTLDANYDFFRIGMGSSFLEGIYGDYYTNCSNTMHQKWLMSNPDNSIYPYPNRARLESMLDKGQIPVIVIPKGDAELGPLLPGSTKKNREEEIMKLINYSFVKEDGKIIGPIVLVLETGAELDDANFVLQEAWRIKDEYPEILVAVDPPKENRIEFLDRIIYGTDLVFPGSLTCPNPMGGVGAIGSGKTEYCVDMIAEDIIFNNFDKCNGNYIMVKLFENGLYNLRNYSKPSIIFTFGGREGFNYDSSCKWFETDLANTYELLMREIPFLTHAGYLSVQACNPSIVTVTSNANPFCYSEDYSLNKGYNKDKLFKVWTVNSWGYIDIGAHSPLVFADNGGYSSGCLGLVNLKWAAPDRFLEITEDRSPSDIEYSFYDNIYNNLMGYGDNVFNYGEYDKCAPAFVCNIHTASSGFTEYGSYSRSREDCSLYDYNTGDQFLEATFTTAGYADKYEFDVFLIRTLAKTTGYDNLDDKSYNFYNSYMKSYNLSKKHPSKFSSDLHWKTREWQILGLAVYDYFGDGDIETLVLSSSSPDNLVSNIKSNYGFESKEFMKNYHSYLLGIECNWYYENMCFN